MISPAAMQFAVLKAIEEGRLTRQQALELLELITPELPTRPALRLIKGGRS